MSLPEFSTQSYLFSTAALSASLFPEDDRYRLFAKLVYPRLVDARKPLASCYCAENGRTAVEPVLLLGISMLQFVDGLPDRAAVEMLKYHAGWNFALNRQLGDPLFHSTTLVNFRQRLIDHDLSALVFQSILEGLVEAGLVQRQSRQRLDSTHIFGRVSRMSRLECMRETLRLAMEELELTAAAAPKPEWWPVLRERYVESKFDFRAETAVLKQKMILAGKDGAQLLAWARRLEEPGSGPQVKLLQRAWNEHFELVSGELQQRLPHPAGALQNPHDPDAQWAAKGQGKHRKEHVGYKVQVAETVAENNAAPGEPTSNFITAIVAQPAIASDDAGLPAAEAEQAQMGMERPSEWYLDGAYISGERLAKAQAEGRQIIGPAQAPPSKDGRFAVDKFDISVEERKAVCPAGKVSSNCGRLEVEETGKVNYRFEFTRHCPGCELRKQCLGKDQRHRTILVGQYHTALQARRREQATDAFKLKAQRRNAIEGTQSELARAHGLRRARYRGLAKVRLQSYLSGAACNLKRWLRVAAWNFKQAAAAIAPEALEPRVA